MGRAFLLTLQFDGTDFCGWQRQKQGRSVQATVEDAMSRLAGEPTGVVGAGRTDAGVHALAMPATVTMPTRWTAVDLLRAANSLLPRSIAVSAVREVVPGTDARRSALGRRYRYDVGIDAASRSPFRGRTEWPLGRQVEMGAMARAAGVLTGEHDFRAFAAVGEPKPHYDCRIAHAAWEELEAGRLRFTIAADRFLHHMVRFIVGTLIDVGLGRRPESDMQQLLNSSDNSLTSPPAPAQGLSFESASYPDNIWLGAGATW